MVIIVALSCAPAPRVPLTDSSIHELSFDRYRAMVHLLDQDDFRFLQAQPGCTPEMVRILRAQRYRIFRGYLRSLEADFKRTSMALKILMVQSRCDRPDLATRLLRSQVGFAYGMVLVRMRAVLYSLGLGTVDVKPLLGLFGALRSETHALGTAGTAISV